MDADENVLAERKYLDYHILVRRRLMSSISMRPASSSACCPASLSQLARFVGPGKTRRVLLSVCAAVWQVHEDRPRRHPQKQKALLISENGQRAPWHSAVCDQEVMDDTRRLLGMSPSLQFQNAQPKMLLLVDNALSFESIEFASVRVCFLLPNTTSFLQPLNAGNITSFEGTYKKLLGCWVLEQLEADGNILRTDISIAMLSIDVWDGVNENTIRSCWRRTGIVPAHMTALLK